MSDKVETPKDDIPKSCESLRNTRLKSNHTYESSPTLQEIKGNATIEYNDANLNKVYINYLLWRPVQRLLCSFKRRSEKTNAAAFQIDFFRECYGNHSPTSTECRFCPLGLDCEHNKKAKNKGQARENIKNQLHESDALNAVKTYFKVQGW